MHFYNEKEFTLIVDGVKLSSNESIVNASDVMITDLYTEGSYIEDFLHF
jgi:hypothetical protein